MRNLAIGIDLIEEIRKKTIANREFDVREWCMNDGEILLKAGQMIIREIKEQEEVK